MLSCDASWATNACESVAGAQRCNGAAALRRGRAPGAGACQGLAGRSGPDRRAPSFGVSALVNAPRRDQAAVISLRSSRPDVSQPNLALDTRRDLRQKNVMLHHNNADAGHAHHAHLAHAAVVSMHVLCCGLPAAFALTSALVGVGVSVGMVAVGGVITRVHAFLHGYELWMLALSAILVTIGGVAEWRNPHRARLPVLFLVSVGCLFLNAAIIAGHRLVPESGAHGDASAHA